MITGIDRKRIAKISGDANDLRSQLIMIRAPYRNIAADKPQVAAIEAAMQSLYDAATTLQALVDSITTA